MAEDQFQKYSVGEKIYRFPTSYSRDKVTDILTKKGIIKTPSVAGKKLNVPGAPRRHGLLPPPGAPRKGKSISQDSGSLPVIGGMMEKGGEDISAGLKSFGEPGLDPKLHGASKLLRGFGETTGPLAAGPLLAAAPVGAVLGTASGAISQQAVEAIAKRANLSPGASELFGDIVGAVAGGAVGKARIPRIPKVAVSTITKTAITHAIDQLPLYIRIPARLLARTALESKPEKAEILSEPKFANYRSAPAMPRTSSTERFEAPEKPPYAPAPAGPRTSSTERFAPKGEEEEEVLPKTPLSKPKLKEPEESSLESDLRRSLEARGITPPGEKPTPKPKLKSPEPPPEPKYEFKGKPEDKAAKDAKVVEYLKSKGISTKRWREAPLDEKNKWIREATGSKHRAYGEGTEKAKVRTKEIEDLLAKPEPKPETYSGKDQARWLVDHGGDALWGQIKDHAANNSEVQGLLDKVYDPKTDVYETTEKLLPHLPFSIRDKIPSVIPKEPSQSVPKITKAEAAPKIEIPQTPLSKPNLKTSEVPKTSATESPIPEAAKRFFRVTPGRAGDEPYIELTSSPSKLSSAQLTEAQRIINEFSKDPLVGNFGGIQDRLEAVEYAQSHGLNASAEVKELLTGINPKLAARILAK